MTREALAAALDEARTLASSAGPVVAVDGAAGADLLQAASETAEVLEALRDVPEGRALLRFTDAPAGDGASERGARASGARNAGRRSMRRAPTGSASSAER